VSSYHRALAHTGIGDFDAAFAMLARACEECDPWMMHLASEPRFVPIRSDARYTAVMSRLGLSQEAVAHA
jgi:hypothetical protein